MAIRPLPLHKSHLDLEKMDRYGLTADAIFERIDARIDTMLAAGFVAEVEKEWGVEPTNPDFDPASLVTDG